MALAAVSGSRQAAAIREIGETGFRKLETEKLRLFAPILGVSFDSLMNRRRRRLRRIALTAAAVVLAAAGAFLGYALNRMQIKHMPQRTEPSSFPFEAIRVHGGFYFCH